MLERVYDTIQGILFHEFPKNNNGQAVVYDRPVTGFYIGDVGVKPNALSVAIKGGSSSLKDIALGLQEYEHNLTVEINAGGDNIALAERITQEATRIILSILRKHRRMWVVELCPICGKSSLTPQHFTIDHSSLLSSYVSTVNSEFSTLWQQTHPSSIAVPTIQPSNLAAEAFLRLYNDVGTGATVSGLSSSQLSNIQRMISDNIEPVRFLYDVICNDNKPSDDATNKQLYRSGTVTVTAKELVKQTQYGPDNVPTTAYS
jgi:hypothetical protein